MDAWSSLRSVDTGLCRSGARESLSTLVGVLLPSDELLMRARHGRAVRRFVVGNHGALAGPTRSLSCTRTGRPELGWDRR